jgi:hypothetical protein
MLILHGEQDDTIPSSHGKRLFLAAMDQSQTNISGHTVTSLNSLPNASDSDAMLSHLVNQGQLECTASSDAGSIAKCYSHTLPLCSTAEDFFKSSKTVCELYLAEKAGHNDLHLFSSFKKTLRKFINRNADMSV